MGKLGSNPHLQLTIGGSLSHKSRLQNNLQSSTQQTGESSIPIFCGFECGTNEPVCSSWLLPRKIGGAIRCIVS